MDAAMRGAQRDQQWEVRAGLAVPITYAPFKFTTHRSRMDWRTLHGVDVASVLRSTDLDALERVASTIAFGDIDSEDALHLSEGSFVKVFRLAQLLVEYLLYVQDSLQRTNALLEQGRAKSAAYLTALRTRCKELEAELRATRRELRHTRKSGRMFELVAHMQQAGRLQAPAQASPMCMVQPSAPVPPPPSQQAQLQLQQAQEQQRAQLAATEERVQAATAACASLKEQRQHLEQELHFMHGQLLAHTGSLPLGERTQPPGQSAQLASTSELESPNASLHRRVWQGRGTDVATAPVSGMLKSGEDSRAAALQQMQQDLQRQLEQLQARLDQQQAALHPEAPRGRRPASEGANGPEAMPEAASSTEAARLLALEREAWAAERARLQCELSAAREERMAAARARDSAAEGGARLAGQVRALEGRLNEAMAVVAAASLPAPAAALTPAGSAQTRGSEDGGHDGRSEGVAGRDAAVGGVARDWKLEELDRLQGENRRLAEQVQVRHAGVSRASPAALPERLVAEAACAVAGAAHLQPSAQLSTGAGARGADHGVECAVRSHMEVSWASGPSLLAAPAAGDADTEHEGPVERHVQIWPPSPNQAPPEPRAPPAVLSTSPTAHARRPSGHAAAAGSQLGPLQSSVAQLRALSVSAAQLPAAVPPPPGPPGLHDDADAAAAEALGAALDVLRAGPPGELSQLCQEYTEDWEKPFMLEPEEDATFRARLPHSMPWRPGVLAAAPHTAQELAAARPEAVVELNTQVNAQLAALGVCPGRDHLTDLELAAAMKQLEAARAGALASLPAAQQEEAEVLRLALLLHLYSLGQNQAAQPSGVPVTPPVLCPKRGLEAAATTDSVATPTPAVPVSAQLPTVAVPGAELDNSGSPVLPVLPAAWPARLLAGLRFRGSSHGGGQSAQRSVPVAGGRAVAVSLRYQGPVVSDEDQGQGSCSAQPGSPPVVESAATAASARAHAGGMPPSSPGSLSLMASTESFSPMQSAMLLRREAASRGP